jgi:hypothetical protein
LEPRPTREWFDGQNDRIPSPADSSLKFAIKIKNKDVPTAFALRIFCATGMQYAAVFPLPVRALANMSRLSKARGMAFD